MKKEIIVQLLKDLEKETCSPRICKAIDYSDCRICNIHKIINRILEELNGS